ncbi:hypothetical protein U5903_07065 [Cereibacter johrii]|uniref:hypothetical protein n=1 Tax=Cereibacter johrii TaxID=445629 RepID=UPI002B257111|nr:hypothetical protein [Cereibacter johrii]MEA5160533.1 hypothetical protein [Cereibacter johrii]
MHRIPSTSTAIIASGVERRAHDHLAMIRAHLESMQSVTVVALKEEIAGPGSALATRRAQLDVRFAVEEMMMLSVAAHHQAGEMIANSIRKEYKAGVIAKKLKEINPNFFPIAISVIESDEPRIDGRFVLREGAHLTVDLAVDYWNRSGDALHARSEPLTDENVLDSLIRARDFLRLCVGLLETFEVDVSGRGMWIGGHLHFGQNRAPQLFFAPHSIN